MNYLNTIVGSITGGFSDHHNNGNFGPFQVCYGYGISVCGGYPGGFQTRGMRKKLFH